MSPNVSDLCQVLEGLSVQSAKHGIAVACILIGHSSIAFNPRQPTIRIWLQTLAPDPSRRASLPSINSLVYCVIYNRPQKLMASER